MLRSVIIFLLGLTLLTFAGITSAGSANEVERVEGAFTEFEVEREDGVIVAVHFVVGDRRVVADGGTDISGGDVVGPAVLLTLEQFVELAEHRELSGAVEGTPGDGVLFALRVFIDPFDVPGDRVTVTGPLTEFEGIFEDGENESLAAVQFLVAGESAVAFDDAQITLERGDRGPIMLRLQQFLELGLAHNLTGTVVGLLEDNVIVARHIKIDPIDDPTGPVVLEGPFADFEPVSSTPPNVSGGVPPEVLTGVSFSVDGELALATEDTQIVLIAPTLAMDVGTQLSLREFLELGLTASLGGRVEGQLRDGTVLARHVLVRRVDRPGERVEVEGHLRACEIGELEAVLAVRLKRSDRVVDLLVTPNTLLFFQGDGQNPISWEDLARLCDGGLVVEVHAKGILIPNASNDAVQITAIEIVFEYVEAAIRGRFQSGEVGNGEIKIAIGEVTVLVDPQTSIEFEGNELSYEGFADLVQSNDTFFARAGGLLRKDGAIQARRMTVKRIDPPIVDVAGRLVSCAEVSAGEILDVTIQRGDATSTVQVTADTRLAEKRGDALAELSLEAFSEKCNARQVYHLFGVGPQAEPLVLAKAVIALVRVRHRGAFQGGEVSEEEIVIGLSDRRVRVDMETEIFDQNREPISFAGFAELVEAGERHRAYVRGVLLKDDSIQAVLLRLRERPNIEVFTPIDGAFEIRGRGTPGIDVEVFDGQGTKLASGAVGITGALQLPTSRALSLGETLTPFALGLEEEAPSVKTEQVHVDGFE